MDPYLLFLVCFFTQANLCRTRTLKIDASQFFWCVVTWMDEALCGQGPERKSSWFQERKIMHWPHSNSQNYPWTVRGMEFSTHNELCGLREGLRQCGQEHPMETHETLWNSREDGESSEVLVWGSILSSVPWWSTQQFLWSSHWSQTGLPFISFPFHHGNSLDNERNQRKTKWNTIDSVGSTGWPRFC